MVCSREPYLAARTRTSSLVPQAPAAQRGRCAHMLAHQAGKSLSGQLNRVLPDNPWAAFLALAANFTSPTLRYLAACAFRALEVFKLQTMPAKSSQSAVPTTQVANPRLYLSRSSLGRLSHLRARTLALTTRGRVCPLQLNITSTPPGTLPLRPVNGVVHLKILATMLQSIWVLVRRLAPPGFRSRPIHQPPPLRTLVLLRFRATCLALASMKMASIAPTQDATAPAAQ